MENSAVDSVIGTVVAKDQDPDQALTFSVKAKTDVQYIKVDTSPDCTTEVRHICVSLVRFLGVDFLSHSLFKITIILPFFTILEISP